MNAKTQRDIFERLHSITLMSTTLKKHFDSAYVTIAPTDAFDQVEDMQRDLKFVEDALSELIDWEKEI